MNMTITEHLTEMEASIKARTCADVRTVPDNYPMFKPVRQGDIYLTKVPDNHAHGKETLDHQLAMGNSKGSRHMADDGFEVFIGTTLPKCFREGTFLGPCIKNKSRATVEHPEHAWMSLPAGTWQVTHQMDMRTRQRMAD